MKLTCIVFPSFPILIGDSYRYLVCLQMCFSDYFKTFSKNIVWKWAGENLKTQEKSKCSGQTSTSTCCRLTWIIVFTKNNRNDCHGSTILRFLLWLIFKMADNMIADQRWSQKGFILRFSIFVEFSNVHFNWFWENSILSWVRISESPKWNSSLLDIFILTSHGDITEKIGQNDLGKAIR